MRRISNWGQPNFWLTNIRESPKELTTSLSLKDRSGTQNAIFKEVVGGFGAGPKARKVKSDMAQRKGGVSGGWESGAMYKRESNKV